MTSELILIPLAIICQFFSCTGLYFIKSYAYQADQSSTFTTLSTITNTFLFCWFLFSFIGRISGAYFFGKYADRNSFFKVMRFVTIGHMLVAILIVTICIVGEDFYNKYQGFYLARFLYSSLVHATVILPAMYLFARYPESKHLLISTYIVLAMFLGKFLAYIFSCYEPSTMRLWYFFPVAGSFLSLGIYAYVEKHSLLSVDKDESPLKYSVPSVSKKIIAMLIGAACNTGIYYYYFFLTPYLRDIAIVQNYGPLKTQSSFYIAFGMFLLPAAKICHKFGIIKIMTISLIWILILGVCIPFLPFSDLAYSVLQIVFAFFLACFVVPVLTVLYQLFKNTKGMFDVIFWFSLGSSIGMLFLGISSRLGFIFHFPLAGMLVFAANIAMCLVGVYTYYNSKKSMSLKSERQHRQGF